MQPKEHMQDHMPNVYRSASCGLCLGLGALLAIGCAPAPKSVACSVDRECQEHDPKLYYCLASHCVECVSSYTCEKGEFCSGGACIEQAMVGPPQPRYAATAGRHRHAEGRH